MSCTYRTYANQQQCQLDCFGSYECRPENGFARCCAVEKAEEPSDYRLWLALVSVALIGALCALVLIIFWVAARRKVLQARTAVRVDPLVLHDFPSEGRVPNASQELGGR